MNAEEECFIIGVIGTVLFSIMTVWAVGVLARYAFMRRAMALDLRLLQATGGAPTGVGSGVGGDATSLLRWNSFSDLFCCADTRRSVSPLGPPNCCGCCYGGFCGAGLRARCGCTADRLALAQQKLWSLPENVRVGYFWFVVLVAAFGSLELPRCVVVNVVVKHKNITQPHVTRAPSSPSPMHVARARPLAFDDILCTTLGTCY